VAGRFPWEEQAARNRDVIKRRYGRIVFTWHMEAPYEKVWIDRYPGYSRRERSAYQHRAKDTVALEAGVGYYGRTQRRVSE
jgi:hypothetical protein